MTTNQITAFVLGANRGLGKRFAAASSSAARRCTPLSARRPENDRRAQRRSRPARHRRSRISLPRSGI